MTHIATSKIQGCSKMTQIAKAKRTNVRKGLILPELKNDVRKGLILPKLRKDVRK